MMTMGRRWITAFGLTLTTAACGSSDIAEPGQDATRIERAQAPDSEFIPVELDQTVDDLVAELNKNTIQPMQMTILLKQLSGFFAPIATGANRAMSELGVTGNVLGLVSTTDGSDATPAQREQIVQAVNDGAEGIGISPQSDANAPAIDEAVDLNAHVVTLDTDTEMSKRAIFVGINNYHAGATAAETLLAALPEPPGTVMIHGNTTPTWYDAYDRTLGAKHRLQDAGYTVIVSQVLFTSSDDDDVAWMKPQLDAADPPVVGMLGLFNVSYRCALAAEAFGKPELPVVAFDFDPKTVELMREGRIIATHTQRQYYEGYLVPYILYGIKTIGLDATRAILAPHIAEDRAHMVNVGFDVVHADKVDAYIDFLDWIGADQ